MPETRRGRPSLVADLDQTAGALVADIALRLGGATRPDAQAEARDLLAALLDVPRHWPILRENKWLEPAVWRQARDAAERRAAGAPLQYAVGRANFRALTLDVDERVLIPRPETELLVDLVLRERETGLVVDVGTGSGAIALALATEGHYQRVIATDLSRDALDVAGANARRMDVALDCRLGDLLHPVAERVDVVVSNPPYIAFDEAVALPGAVRNWEPPLALFSARDGLALTARLVRQSATRLKPGGLLALEVDARRASLVADLVAREPAFREAGTDVRVHLDLAGRERFVLAHRGEHE